MGGKLIYIQNPKTRQLLGSDFHWVDSPDEAKTFNSAIVAYDFAIENDIAEVEIVFQKSSKIESVLHDLARNGQASPC
ncbi:MAG: hypothetical protein H0X66_21995 [Verrucomicrobia bacterium]|nr:hypothetical protein [Verrucomicrobiota bacterium]